MSGSRNEMLLKKVEVERPLSSDEIALFENSMPDGLKSVSDLLGIDFKQDFFSADDINKCWLLLNALNVETDDAKIDAKRFEDILDGQISKAAKILESNLLAVEKTTSKLKSAWNSLRQLEELSQQDLSDISLLLLNPDELESEANRKIMLETLKTAFTKWNDLPEKNKCMTYFAIPNLDGKYKDGIRLLTEELLSVINDKKSRVFGFFILNDLPGAEPNDILKTKKNYGDNLLHEKYKYLVLSSCYPVISTTEKIDALDKTLHQKYLIPPSVAYLGWLTNNNLKQNLVPIGFRPDGTDSSRFLPSTSIQYDNKIDDPQLNMLKDAGVSPLRPSENASGQIQIIPFTTITPWKGNKTLGQVKIDLLVKRAIADHIFKNVIGNEIRTEKPKLQKILDDLFKELNKNGEIKNGYKIRVLEGQVPNTLEIYYEIGIEGQVDNVILAGKTSSGRVESEVVEKN
jgi:hypothetical protein